VSAAPDFGIPRDWQLRAEENIHICGGTILQTRHIILAFPSLTSHLQNPSLVLPWKQLFAKFTEKANNLYVYSSVAFPLFEFLNGNTFKPSENWKV